MTAAPGASIEAVLSSPAFEPMRALRRWIPYRLIPRPGQKPTKVPWLGYPVDAHNEQNHSSAAEAATLARGFGPEVGLAFVFRRSDGFFFIDVDHAYASGEWSSVARQLCSVFSGAATEISISGDGLHIFGRGSVPPHNTSNAQHGIELYDSGRFCALTGDQAIGSAGMVFNGEIPWLVNAYFKPEPSRGAVSITAHDWLTKTAKQQAETLQDLRDALKFISPEDQPLWYAVGENLSSLGDLGYELWEEWSATSLRYPGGDGLDNWGRFRGTRSDYRTVFEKAKANGWVNPRIKIKPAEIFGKPAAVARTIDSNAPTEVVSGGAGPHSSVIVPPVPTTPVQTFAAGGAKGVIEATIENIVDTFRSPESPIILGFDNFTQSLSVGPEWRSLTDNDYGVFRWEFGRRGYKPIKSEIMKTSVEIVCRQNTFDSAIQWASSLKWDGTPRVDSALSRYYGASDTPYTRAVARYLFTALAGRALEPGCHADMAVIFVGLQGAQKTSSVRILAPYVEAFREVSLSMKDDNLARAMRGVLLVELREMDGLHDRRLESARAWVSRRVEQWNPKFKEFDTSFARRCIVIGTANNPELLDDPEGERRWLPTRVSQVDIPSLERDRDQLWAEGVSMWHAGGIAWRDAEHLAKAEHIKFKVRDLWEDPISAWLKSSRPGEAGKIIGHGVFSTYEAATLAIGIRQGDLDHRTKTRLGKILRNLGYDNRQRWLDGENLMRWSRV